MLRSALTQIARLRGTPLGARLRTSRLGDRATRLVKRGLGGDAVVRGGPCAGAAFNTFGESPGYLLGTKELDVQEAFVAAIPRGAVVWDVGAALGFFSVLGARATGPDGVVVAFEPLPDNQEAARHNAGLNGLTGVRVLPLALGDREGEARFRLGRARTQGRLATLEGTPASVGSGEITVAVRVADDLVAAGTVPPPAVIKLDIEGAEVEMLRGARRVLADHRPTILAEMHGRCAEVAEVLEAAGYETRVLGSDVPLAAAPWSCHVLATPRP